MLTGKDIHTAFAQVDRCAKGWDNLNIMQQATYDNVASKLNEAHIAPLQGVVKELVALLEDDELMIEDSPDGWYDRKRKAYDTAQQLLKEDIPC